MVQNLMFVSAMIALLLVMAALGRRRQKEFEQRFPPISDAEFLAGCSPGVNPHVALKVRQILSEALAVEHERIYPSARLMADLGAE
jgi:hypothetical protein